MEPFREYKGLVYPLERTNVDTDQIIPKQFLKRIERQGFGECLFYHWRFDENGQKRAEFLLNADQYQEASILVSGHNFGCGSSREHAPWALSDFGFKVIIAPSFADIFYNNCFKNGLLPIVLNEKDVEELIQKAKSPGFNLHISLENQTVEHKDFKREFQIDPYHKEMLLNGLDEISMTLTFENQISHYEQKQLTTGW
ncbi:3-isopropylmalate/(R)-2-methylmalate dehydratase small subunit [Scopulibacillus darangshiensis]|uniref:3-isopropylmalate dehydratase small subunit n=1 Tax=Scopulibacillus darangshiensis TaxID=442528 RepID=A0A4R2P2R1_9BACL|nr:3-isopropylmalate dehydratase small subunit [Scopulibacillus darangshiensis]TCP28922.1 3-isopropylmalate/(R)-2-methylmalate dehydratase small subunit [Scopulibacillus darangshiensis]